MKIFLSAEAKRQSGIFISLFTIGIISFCILGYFVCLQLESAFTAGQNADKFEVRSRLLTEATDETGVCNAERAAQVWASGLQKRSAALQYTVMTKTLKDEYARQLESSFPNWVTGVSSPWVDSFEIKKTEVTDDNNYIFHILFRTATSTGPAGDYNAVISVTREGDFWRITKINADKQLYVYTGFQPLP